MGESHDRILRRKRTLIGDLVQTRPDSDDAVVVDVLLALADTRSCLGRWIRGGDESAPQEDQSIASFVFVGEDAVLFLGDIPSFPGLVVLVVDQENLGIIYRFISAAPQT